MSYVPHPWDDFVTAERRAPRKRKEGISYGRAMTLRNNAMIEGGKHPMTKMPLREPRGETCGSCRHSIAHSVSKRYFKCNLVPITFGPGTDIRLKWPACVKWEAARPTSEETPRDLHSNKAETTHGS
jgi:hypothetical protein